ncbi:MAG: hypothetical protein ACJAYB_000113 [Psychromonas sp.]|jgi:hypothetical protein
MGGYFTLKNFEGVVSDGIKTFEISDKLIKHTASITFYSDVGRAHEILVSAMTGSVTLTASETNSNFGTVENGTVTLGGSYNRPSANAYLKFFQIDPSLAVGANYYTLKIASATS